MMKAKIFIGGLAVFLTVSLLPTSAHAGNGAPNGGCYNLQVIGVPSKKADLTDSNRHSLFVPIGGKTKILLSEGDFQVLDGNGTDGSAAFRLPNPDPTNSGVSAYSVYARVVGKPGGAIDMNTCAYDTLGDLYCSQDTLSMKRISGNSKFQNVSQDLLYIYADIDDDGQIDRVPLFSDQLSDYYWNVDTTGRAHAQLKFCPVATTVAAP
jgi:hypothetical protein